jgi:ABC-type phosphate transport system substrate-binding protein
MMQHKKFSPQQFGWVCALVAASTPLTTSFSVLANAQVQSPDEVKNAKIRIHSSNSMMGLNKSLKQQFEGKYSGSSVTLNTMSAQKAIDDVANNTAEVAAIGRPLTPAKRRRV